MSGRDHVERELKLGAWPGFVVPDLNGIVPGATTGEVARRELDATYFDTPDLRLLRRGVTLRFRRGEPPAHVWTIKLPSDNAALGLAREEISVPGTRQTMPTLVSDLASGWARGRGLRPVARMRTTRTTTPLCNQDGGVIATVDDDEVVVARGRRVLARFRELEVELANDGGSDLLSATDERLRGAGAKKVPQMPKLTRALGRAAAEPSDLAIPALGSKPTAADAARAELMRTTAAVIDLHAALVLDVKGAADQALAVLQALDAQHAAYSSLLEPLAADPGVGWLDQELRAVSELDYLIENGGPLIAARLTAARTRARAALLRTLRGRKYMRLLHDLAGSPTRAQPVGLGRRRIPDAYPKLLRAAHRHVKDDELLEARSLLALLPQPGAQLAGAASDVAALSAEVNRADAVVERLRQTRRRLDARESWEAGLLAGLTLAEHERWARQLREALDQLTAKENWRAAE